MYDENPLWIPPIMLSSTCRTPQTSLHLLAAGVPSLVREPPNVMFNWEGIPVKAYKKDVIPPCL